MPPLLEGAAHVTDACPPPGVADGEVGAPGTVAGVAVAAAVPAELVPAWLVAVTLKVYATPLVRPVKVHEVPVMLVQPAGGVTAGLEVTE